MKLPKAVSRVVDSFEALPGIGPKTAQRLAFYLLHVPQHQLDTFSEGLSKLRDGTVICQNCFSIGDSNICQYCSDDKRDQEVICIVEDPLDAYAIDKSGEYRGVFHVLHGVIDPLNSIGPDDIYIPQLIQRIKSNESNLKEIIIATNPTMEGEATAMYIASSLEGNGIKVTRIGRGLPTGADLEYADEVTVARALEGRREF